MKKLGNTLFFVTPDVYVSLDGENIVLKKDGKEAMRRPLHYIDSIVCFGYFGISPALMAKCASDGIAVSFHSPSGRLMARVVGKTQGNVLLRKTQVYASDAPARSMPIARACIAAKIYNARWALERATRDHALRLDVDKIKAVSQALQQASRDALQSESEEMLRGVEGNAASMYFSVLDDLILQQKDQFYFRQRTRRPPMDAFNAMLSFCYALLTNDMTSALETVGLDPYIGFMHADRPGRASLALDLIEELRVPMVDRFVLSMVNRQIVSGDGFTQTENGAVLMDDDTRRLVLKHWQLRKQTEITHPFLKEKVAWGVIPYAQALLLARHLRGDLDAYPSFLWK
nr:type I-C CRISPR-associated endonuclease Cas1c [Maliibacterium massiliense]